MRPAHRLCILILRPILAFDADHSHLCVFIPSYCIRLSYVPVDSLLFLPLPPPPDRWPYLMVVSKVPSWIIESRLAFGCTKSKLLYNSWNLPCSNAHIMQVWRQVSAVIIPWWLFICRVWSDGWSRKPLSEHWHGKYSQGFEAVSPLYGCESFATTVFVNHHQRRKSVG